MVAEPFAGAALRLAMLNIIAEKSPATCTR
jgi:hypothetical protein